MQTVRRDKAFFSASGGGMTVSGGEPTSQPDFLIELLSTAKKEGIHTCLETNGYIPDAGLRQILPLVDLFLLDFKLTENEGLQPYTCASGPMWQNTMDVLSAAEKPVILRLPVIPGINDTAAHFHQAAAFQKGHPNVLRIEIMPYHSIGAAKWEQLGLKYSLPDLETVSADLAEKWRAQLKAEIESL